MAHVQLQGGGGRCCCCCGGGGGEGQILAVKVEKRSEDDENEGKEIVLKVHMHCEGCATKVFNSLKGFEGVEEIKTDRESGKVIVKGQNVNALKVLERVKKKYSRNAELIYPKPKLPKHNDQKELQPNKETPIKVVVLKMHMHCEGCAHDIKRSIERMKGILSAIPDMEKSTVTVRGDFDPQKLVETINRRMGKYAEIVAEDVTKAAAKAKEENIIFHYPPQSSLQHTCPTQFFSDESISSCSLM